MDIFHIPTLDDKEWMQEILKETNAMCSAVTFGSSYVWQEEYATQICQYKNFLLTSYVAEDNDNIVNFTFPVGKGDEKEAIEFMFSLAKEKGLTPTITCMGQEQADIMESLFPNSFKTDNKRDIAEYIYLSEDLAFLKGRKFHGKRNHLKRFKETYDWSYEAITDKNLDDAVYVAKEWCIAHGCKKGDAFAGERCALKKTFEHFNEIGMKGGLLRVDNKPVAMAIGEEVSPNCFVIHFEKAVDGIQGGFTAINNLFALELSEKYKYINREEDLGIEGMRKAKLSYRPTILLEKIVFS